MRLELEQLHLEDRQQSIDFRNIEKWRFKPYWHFHPEIELTLILKGKGIRYVGNSIQPFKAGDLVMIGENLPHHWVSDKILEEMAHALVIQFNPKIFEKIHACKHFLLLFERAKHGIQFQCSDRLQQLFSSFEDSSRAGRLACLINILDTLVTSPDQEALSTKTYTLSLKEKYGFAKSEKVTGYILENLNRKLTVGEVAEIAHLTPQSFCRWFKKSTGHSFVNFVSISRVENACQLLLTSDMTVSTVALECGFESISQFNRVFKKHKGVTATTFRKSIK